MLSRSRWARPAGALSIAVLAGAAFTGCGDDGEDGDTSTDEGTEEGAADGGENADGPPTEAPPEAAEFCEAYDEFELTVVGGMAGEEGEAPAEAEYFAAVSENFDTLADTEAPEEIADAWATWTTSVSEAYDQLAADVAEADPDDPESGVLSEDFVSPDDDEAVVDAEMEINAYREENCPPPEDIEVPGGADGAEAEDAEAAEAAEGDGEGEGADAEEADAEEATDAE